MRLQQELVDTFEQAASRLQTLGPSGFFGAMPKNECA